MTIVRHYRSSRGSRSGSMRAPIRSYKKVLNIIPASYGAGFVTTVLVNGTDSLAAGQTSNTDGAVPTGCIIKYIEVQQAIGALVIGTPCFINTSFQYTLGGQTAKDPIVIGGDTQRNQVLHQTLFQVGADGSNSRVYRFKIPKRFQRIKEGMKWTFSWRTSATASSAMQIIYKFYQ